MSKQKNSHFTFESQTANDSMGPAERRLLADAVADKIRDAILAGQLAPEERILEEHLASVLRVSRGPVREALTQLEREGLVLKLRNRATIVARLTPEDADELYSLRLALERLAVTRAVERASESEISVLQRIVDRMKDVTADTVAMAAQLDVQFHEALVDLSHHQRLSEAWRNLKSQITVLLLSRNAVKDFHSLITKSHQDLVDAIRERDLNRALEIIDDHMWGSYSRVLQGQGAPVPERNPRA